MNTAHRTCLLSVTLGLLLAACGGGSAQSAGVGIGGTGKPGITIGTVESGAGLTVNDIAFMTTAATVQIDGQVAQPSDLKHGHVAVIEGSVEGATGVAETVTVDEVVKGTLQARPAANLLTVQGLSVEIDDRTVYGSGLASADSLLIGDLLEVWGFVKGPGLVRATRIERESSLSEIEIVGIVSNVDTGADTFEIGAQTIDYSGADMSDVPGGDPANGDLVSVEGAAALGGGGEVVATSVELLDLEDAPDNDDTSIEGFVTALQSSTRFELGGVVVETTAQTEYVGGVALDVVLGAELEVHGSLAAGVLTARRIEFEGSVEIEGDVSQIAGNLISIQGLPGLVIQVDGLTEFDGDAASLADIALGDHLKLDARIVGGSTVVAIEVEEGDADTTISLQGPVAAMPAPADPLFSILGVVVDTSTIAAGKFEGPDGAPLARGTFFALLVPGRLVEVKGDLVGGNPVWDEAELEDE